MKRGASRADPQAALWAALTIIAFPIVAISAGWLGAGSVVSFLLGALGSALVLVVEGLTRGRWWIADPAMARVLASPVLGYRLLIVVSLAVLLFETYVLVGFMTNGAFDASVARLALTRSCDTATDDWFLNLCRANSPSAQDDDLDLAAAAVREAAEKRFFAGGLVSCAAKPLVERRRAQTALMGMLVRCDRWVVSRIAGKPLSVQTVQKPIVAALSLRADGAYRVDGWSDDPTSPAWSAVGDVIAQATKDMSGRPLSKEDEDRSASESQRRLLERLAR